MGEMETMLQTERQALQTRQGAVPVGIVNQLLILPVPVLLVLVFQVGQGVGDAVILVMLQVLLLTEGLVEIATELIQEEGLVILGEPVQGLMELMGPVAC